MVQPNHGIDEGLPLRTNDHNHGRAMAEQEARLAPKEQMEPVSAESDLAVSYPTWWPEAVRAAEKGNQLPHNHRGEEQHRAEHLYLVENTPPPLVDKGTEWYLICPACERPVQEIKCKLVCTNCRTIVQSCCD